MNKLRTMTFLRQAETDPAVDDPRLQRLSDRGREQALERRMQLHEPKFDLIFHSPFPGTVETACIVAGSAETEKMETVHDLFFHQDDPRGAVFDLAFKKLGHKPLSAYFAENEAMQSILIGAENAYLPIASIFERRDAWNALIIGHDILLPALCNKFCGNGTQFNEQAFGECQGVRIKFGENHRPTGWETIS